MKEGGKDSGATDSYDYRTQLPSIPKLQHYRIAEVGFVD
jgi:hypothetical protein